MSPCGPGPERGASFRQGLVWAGLFLALAICLAPGRVDAGQRQVAMITWRGETEAEKGFIQALALGRHDIALTKYHADQDPTKLCAIIAAIEKSRPDLVYVFGTTATKAVLSRIQTIPVVFNIVSRPVDSGIIASWESSKNNATGASNKVSPVSQLKTLKKVVDFKRLGIIFNPMEDNSIIQRKAVKALESRLGFTLIPYPIACEADIDTVLPHLENRVDAVFIPSDSMVKSLGKKIMAHVNAYAIPSISSVGSMVPQDGVLLGFVPKYLELGQMAAKKAALILDGRHPSQIPSSVLDYYNLSVNMRTARQIQVQIPLSLLVMANQIVR